MQVSKRIDPNIPTTSFFSKLGARGSSILAVLRSNPKLCIGLGTVVFFVLVALFAPLLTSYNPDSMAFHGAHPPSAAHIFGTTGLGQDLFAQIVYGSRVSLIIGVIAACGSTLLQVFFGLTSAYFSGFVGETLGLIINIFLVLPGLPLTIVLASLASASGANRSEIVIALVLLFTSWSYGARVLRSQTLSLKERDFVAAARASGETTLRIIFFEILPNEIALVAATFVGTAVYVIGAEVALEFLGLGDTSRASWGAILYWAQTDAALPAGQWWLFVPAGLCVALLCSGLAFINFGIDEIANPRLRRERPRKAARTKKEVVA